MFCRFVFIILINITKNIPTTKNKVTKIRLVQALEEFDKTFGPDLKSVTGDHEQVDKILCRVAELSLPIEGADFNPFNICNLSSWKMIMHNFNTAVKVG